VSCLSRVRRYLRAHLEPREVEAEIDEEIRYHLEMRAREYRARGASNDAAEELARRRFGDVSRVRAECRSLAMVERSGRRDSVMIQWLSELRYALRSLRKSPGFSLVVVATLALGVGANTAIFSLVDGVLLRPLPFEAPERLARLWENDRLRGTTQENFSAPDFFDVARDNDVFEDLALFTSYPLTLTEPSAEPERVRVTAVSRNLLDVLGVAPALGRGFSPEEDVPGAPRVAMLAHGLWMRRFGGEPDVLGRTLDLEGVSREVVGVLPEGLDFPSAATEVFIPAAATPTSPPRGQHGFSVVARLRPGVGLERADAELGGIAAALEAQYADDNEGRGMWAESLSASLVGDVETRLWVLFGAVLLVLLVASVNVANLFLSRAVARGQETAIRAAMGAGRRRLVRESLTESLLLTLAGGLGGVLLAHGLLGTFLAIVPEGLPRVGNVGLNGTVLAFAFLISAATGVLFGLVPALRAASGSFVATLREGGRSGRSVARPSLRRALVTAEIALAVALVVGAGLLIHSFWKLTGVDPGFRARQVLTTGLALPSSRYPTNFDNWPSFPEVSAFHRELLRRLSEVPGIEEAALALESPLDEGFTSRFTIEGRPEVAPGQQDEVRVRAVSAGYFRTLGIPVVRGREPDADLDRDDSPLVTYVNEAFARRYFPDGEAIGARIQQWGVSREIVGVVRDVRFQGLTEEVPPAVYPLLVHAPFSGFSVFVRTREVPERAAARVREAIWAIDRDLALSPFETLDAQLTRSVAEPRFTMLVFVFFGAVALALAAIGIYGITSYAVRQRTREIGVRMSLGARRADVLRLVLVEGARMAGAGIFAGLLLAMGLGRLLESLLFGVERTDPVTFLVVAVVAVLVALAATYAPAARASKMDPVLALRSE
jgi:predicted permease